MALSPDGRTRDLEPRRRRKPKGLESRRGQIQGSGAQEKEIWGFEAQEGRNPKVWSLVLRGLEFGA